MEIFKQYLLMKASLRMMIEWPILIGVGVLGIIFQFSTFPFYPIINLFGFFLLIAGFIIHRASHQIHKQAHLKSEEVERLVSGGIYSKMRHPGYLGIILMYFGFAFAWGIVWLLLPVAIFILMTVLTALREEEMMRKKFGKEYDEYIRRVPWRFIPKVF